MAKPRTFKSDTGVSVYITGRPDPIRVNAGVPYETSDPREIDALAGSPDVSEVKQKEKSREQKDV